jgi:hypothetical protein
MRLEPSHFEAIGQPHGQCLCPQEVRRQAGRQFAQEDDDQSWFNLL